MRFYLPLVATGGLFALAASTLAQSPTPPPTPAAAASPSPTPTKRQRHKKADAAAATTPAPADSPAASSTSPAPVKKSKEERDAAKKARLDKLAAMTPAPGGGPGMVWVNSESKAYHDSSSPYYGKTKHGKYMTKEAADAEGDHPAGQRRSKQTAKPQ